MLSERGGSGKRLPWLAEIGLSARTAQHYMKCQHQPTRWEVNQMSQQFDEYIAAKAECDKATETVERVIGSLKKFAEPLLQNWRNCYVEVGQGIPMGLVNRRAVNANDLPPPADIRMR
jgi:hypothetical protein